MLPQSNATLVSITAGTSVRSEDWDVSSDTGTITKWSGSSDAYYMEKTRTRFAQGEGGLQRERDVTLLLPATLFANGVVLEEGDILTYVVNGVQHSRRAMSQTSAYMSGVPNYVRVAMNPEPVELALEQN